MTCRSLLASALLALTFAGSAAAQQRPLTTEDPEPVGAGRLLIQGGVDYLRDEQYPVSGLEGNLLRVPTLGVSLGISSIAEFQIDGVSLDRLAITQRNPGPLSDLPKIAGASSAVGADDIVVGTKIRVVPEGVGHPAFAFRFFTKVPNADWQKGIGLDTTDFSGQLLMAKTVESIRVVANIGEGIIATPVDAHEHDHALLYGLSLARAVTDRTELVGELNGRASTRSGGPLPGTESRSLLKIGGRYTKGSVRLDAAAVFGLTSFDPTVGFTTGFTYVFHAFNVP